MENNKKPEFRDFITKRCLRACSKEKIEAHQCTCVNNSRNYQQALKEWENDKNNKI